MNLLITDLKQGEWSYVAFENLFFSIENNCFYLNTKAPILKVSLHKFPIKIIRHDKELKVLLPDKRNSLVTAIRFASSWDEKWQVVPFVYDSDLAAKKFMDKLFNWGYGWFKRGIDKIAIDESLESQLKKAESKENYKEAARLRDLITKQNKQEK